MKVTTAKAHREEILQFIEAFKGKIHAVYKNSLILSLTGSSERLNDFIEIMRGFGILEMVRTGASVLTQKE
jgi:acetolactate synthase-1/3 small subunit